MAISVSVGQRVLCKDTYGNNWGSGLKIKAGTVGIVLSVFPDGSKCEIGFELRKNLFENRKVLDEKDFAKYIIPISS